MTDSPGIARPITIHDRRPASLAVQAVLALHAVVRYLARMQNPTDLQLELSRVLAEMARLEDALMQEEIGLRAIVRVYPDEDSREADGAGLCVAQASKAKKRERIQTLTLELRKLRGESCRITALLPLPEPVQVSQPFKIRPKSP